MTRYDTVARNFERFFNYEELEIQFAKKASVEDLNSLYETKADRQDLDNVREGLIDFNEKLKHISVFLTEVATNFPAKDVVQETVNVEKGIREKLKE